MPRRNAPVRRQAPATGAGRKASEGRPAQGAGGLNERVESWRGLDYRVRAVTGSSSAPYRCPGCDQLLPTGRGHVVTWPADDLDAEDRRHWHTTCWAAREQRSPTTVRSRNAPRYG